MWSKYGCSFDTSSIHSFRCAVHSERCQVAPGSARACVAFRYPNLVERIVRRACVPFDRAS
jgi:hypothetical protein